MSYEQLMIENEQQYPGQLSEPHFIEESTVVSARKVVPLETVQGREMRRRVGLFIGGVLLAMVLGGATALVLYSKRTSVADTPSEPALAEQAAPEPEVPAETASVTEDQTEGPTQELTEESIEAPTEELVVDPPIASVSESTAKKRSRSPREVRRAERPVVSDAVEPDGSYSDWQETRDRRVQERREQMIEERRQMRREYRREARRQRRERWRNGDTSEDDLFRIREIFEGRRPRS